MVDTSIRTGGVVSEGGLAACKAPPPVFCEGGDRSDPSGCHIIKSQRHVTTLLNSCVDEDAHRERSFLYSAVPDLATDPCLVSSWTRRRRHYRSSFPQALVAWGVASGVPFQSTYVLVLYFVVGRSVAVALLYFLGLINV